MSINAIDLLDPSVSRKMSPVGTDVLHLKDPVTGRDHWVLLQDLFTPPEQQIPTWNDPDFPPPYAIDDQVIWQGKIWKSLTDNNSTVPNEGANWTTIPSPSPTPVTQEYVDEQILSQINGLRWKNPVRARTTGALPANTAAGMTLTANANGAFPSQDGVSLDVNDDILVMNEDDETKNGIYSLTQEGGAGAAWILTRRADADSSIELQNAVVSVDVGLLYKDTSWRQTNDSVTVGAHDIVWAVFGGFTNLAAENEMMKSNGNHAVASKIFSEADGDLTLGANDLPGSRIIRIRSSTASARLAIGGGADVVLFTASPGGAVTAQLRYALGVLEFYTNGLSSANNNIIAGELGVGAGGNGGNLTIRGGFSSQTSGDSNGGHTVIKSGRGFGTGKAGDIILSPEVTNDLPGLIKIDDGDNDSMGASTLVAGTVTVNNKKVTATTRIFLTGQNSSGAAGELTVSARVPGTSFTITSTSGTDTRLIAWLIFEPN